MNVFYFCNNISSNPTIYSVGTIINIPVSGYQTYTSSKNKMTLKQGTIEISRKS